MPDLLSVAIVELRRDEVTRQLQARIAAGEDPLAFTLAILGAALLAGFANARGQPCLNPERR